MNEILLLIIVAIIGGASIAIIWQIRKLRLDLQAVTCQDIVQKFNHIVANPDFRYVFSFGSEGQEMTEETYRKTALCSMVFAFLEQIYVESSGGQLAKRLNGPWVEFTKHWLNQEAMKTYWGNSRMICPKSGFDDGFREFVDQIYGDAYGRQN